MFRVCVVVLLGGLFALSGALVAQEPKKDEPPGKVKGVLPGNWKKLGLSEEQVQKIYKIQGKYDEEIDKLKAKMDELKAAMDKERKTVLTAEQKKRLEDILLGKDK